MAFSAHTLCIYVNKPEQKLGLVIKQKPCHCVFIAHLSSEKGLIYLLYKFI